MEPWPGVELPARWRGLEAGRLTYSAPEADKAVRFFSRYCRHVKGELAGQPFLLSPWQERRIIRPIFGLMREDGTRAIRRVYVEIPRKNGKSMLGSGIAAKCLYADGEPGAEVYSAAVDKGQASLVYDVAAQFVDGSPDLRSRSRIYRGNQKRIVNTRTNGFYTVVSADAKRAHGFNSHAIIGDELHAWKGDFSGSLLEALTTSTSARRQPLVFFITTAGFDRESVCFREYTRACQIRDGLLVKESYLPVIYEVPREADWKDPAVWAEANPGLGISKKLEYMAEACALAGETPADLNTFLRLDLDVWTEQKTRWITPEAWAACADPELEPPSGCCTVFLGLDLSTREDTTAVAIAWRHPDGRVALHVHTWIPEENALARESKEHVPYKRWAELGLVTMTPGTAIDYGSILSYVEELGARCSVELAAYDEWQAEMFRQRLEFLGFPTMAFRQGWRTMGEPTATFGRLWKSKQLVHDGNECLAFQASNTAVIEDAGGNLKPAKNLSGDRIDGIVASIMAVWSLLAGEHAVTAEEILG